MKMYFGYNISAKKKFKIYIIILAVFSVCINQYYGNRGIYPVESSLIYTYLDKNCFTEIKISNMLNSYELKNCHEING